MLTTCNVLVNIHVTIINVPGIPLSILTLAPSGSCKEIARTATIGRTLVTSQGVDTEEFTALVELTLINI